MPDRAPPTLRLTVALALALGAGAGFLTAAPLEPRPDLVDGHDSKETALLIELDQVVRGHLWPRKDHDFYHFWLPSAGLLRIRHGGLAPTVASAIKVHDERGTLRRWVNGHPGRDNAVEAGIPRAGRYWVEVADSKDTNYSELPYTLELGFQAVVDPHEPNDLAREATPLTLPATVEGYLFPAGDLDRFRVLVTGPGCLQLLLTGGDPAAGSRIMVQNEDGLKVTGWVTDPNRGYQNLLLNVNHTGVYEILLAAHRPRNDLRPYRLRVEYHPATTDPHEPNDDLGRATPIVPGQVVRAWILPARDRDVYRLDLRGVGRLIVRQTGLRGGLRSAIDVRGPGGRTSLTDGVRVTEPGATEHELRIPIRSWGDYYVIVSSPDFEGASVDPYGLTCIFYNRQRAHPQIPAEQGVPPALRR